MIYRDPNLTAGILPGGGIIGGAGIHTLSGESPALEPANLLSEGGTDRLIRPVGDTTTEHLVAPGGQRYDIQPI